MVNRSSNGNLRQDVNGKRLKNMAVTKEARNSDVAHDIEDRPFVRIDLKPLAVSGDILQAERLYAALQALAHLAMDLAEAVPAQIEARQSPLQEGYTIGVAHQLLSWTKAPLQ